MINLLPKQVKSNITYARSNSKLRQWIGIFLLSIVGIGIITVLGLFYINQSIKKYTTDNTNIQQNLNNQDLEGTKTQVKDISDNLKLTVQVLSREILFSDLIKQVGNVMPLNTILTGLDISKVQGGIDLQALAKDYGTASQIQVNLQDPKNQVFDKADIVNISCSKNSADNNVNNPGYPCTVTIRAQFAKNNPYLFINSGSQK